MKFICRFKHWLNCYIDIRMCAVHNNTSPVLCEFETYSAKYPKENGYKDSCCLCHISRMYITHILFEFVSNE